ncbi:helicase associated domain-containing protein [Streptomyces sp. NPDC004680]|uniref:helicase associated domain-containing protein n=1 Tax=Streptomyces sp. NPDC004680 TaxID=3154287 RepID=UPI0033B729B1
MPAGAGSRTAWPAGWTRRRDHPRGRGDGPPLQPFPGDVGSCSPHPRGWSIEAARQFHTREGHLTVPRKHVETVDGEAIRLGSFVDSSRRRAAKLSAQRRADLDELGMRW